MLPHRLALLLCCLWLPLPVLAQDAASPVQPGPEVTPPPLVPATPGSPAPSDSPQTFPGDSRQAAPEAPPPGEIIHRPRYAEPRSAPTFPRLILEIVGGSVGASVGILPGSLILFSTVVCNDNCTGREESRALLGLGIAFAGFSGGAALGIFGAGSLMSGEGEFWPTAGGAALGTLAGIALGLALASSAGEAAILPFLAGPIVGGMIGYELSHSNAIARRQLASAPRPSVMPMATVSPHGGVIGGLAGRF